MFTTKITKLAQAICEAEGWIAKGTNIKYLLGSDSWQHHNPGNLRVSTYAVGYSFGFAIFENDLMGFYAIIHQLYLYASGHSTVVPPNDSIADVISHYNGLNIGTPEFENYISIIEKVGGVSRKDKISSILP